MAAKKGKMTAYLKKVVFSVSYQFRKSLKNTRLFSLNTLKWKYRVFPVKL